MVAQSYSVACRSAVDMQTHKKWRFSDICTDTTRTPYYEIFCHADPCTLADTVSIISAEAHPDFSKILSKLAMCNKFHPSHCEVIQFVSKVVFLCSYCAEINANKRKHTESPLVLACVAAVCE